MVYPTARIEEINGDFSSTILTLFAVPVLYRILPPGIPGGTAEGPNL